ncbi:MAG TPA: hypothetical protein VMV69_27230, partial [Pirellulales bacterium]|nr:hypothetical protein [Pirellulales bacterium]
CRARGLATAARQNGPFGSHFSAKSLHWPPMGPAAGRSRLRTPEGRDGLVAARRRSRDVKR